MSPNLFLRIKNAIVNKHGVPWTISCQCQEFANINNKVTRIICTIRVIYSQCTLCKVQNGHAWTEWVLIRQYFYIFKKSWIYCQSDAGLRGNE